MHEVEWTDGLSTGIDAIDDDHKQLLLLMNNISAAIESQQTHQVIGDVFDQLEVYAHKHFAREEDLLRQCRYADLEAHITTHRAFTDKIPELKQRLLTSSSRQVAEEVNLFLINWLINHIVADDLRYIPAMARGGLTKQQPQVKARLLKRGADWLSQHIRLKQRILLTALLPVCGLLLISMIVIWNSANQWAEMRSIQGVISLTTHTGTLIHSLQAERGLSTGMISSEYQQFGEALAQQRQQSDAAMEALADKLDRFYPAILSDSFAEQVRNIKSQLTQLPRQRRQIDNRSLTTTTMQAYYTLFISQLLAVHDGLLQQPMRSTLSNQIASLSALMHLQEAAGLQRAQGTLAIEQNSLQGELLRQFLELSGQERSLSQIFNQLASPVALKQWQEFNRDSVVKHSKALTTTLIDAANKGSLRDMDSTQWFALMSQKIDLLHALSTRLIANLESDTVRYTAEQRWQLFGSALLLVTLFILALILSRLLTLSITRPIGRLTRAMAALATGNRERKLREPLAKDELKQITAAYELCRLGLLQGDLEELELQYKHRESEHYKELASTDPLTGAYNRRQFDQLSYAELQRSRRHGGPLSTLMVDLDHFKKINDSYGHASGDLMLKTFVHTCKEQLRSSDILARIGGEEFVILLPETNTADALQLAERIRKAIRAIEIGIQGQILRVTVSIGAAQWDVAANEDLDSLFAKADKALYRAKSSGRDRVCVEPHLPGGE